MNGSTATSTYRTDHIWCVIPVFNNAASIVQVAREAQTFVPQVVVVDDGSADADVSALLAGSGFPVIRHEKNMGKGAAVLTGLDYVSRQQGRFMITMDGDGQHFASDLQRFIPLLQDENDPVMVIGCRRFDSPNVPGSSRFGRKFANFWLRVEAGVSIDDCQSGFRAYPVSLLQCIKLHGKHYDFETEILARAAWAGITFKTVSIGVFYPEPSHRVSAFKPFRDNLRISLMHARLIGRRLVPWPHRKLVPPSPQRFDPWAFLHPIRLIRSLLREHASPLGLAVAAGVGSFLAVLPLISLHTVVILYVATRLHLNKVMAVSIQHLFMPPLVPLLCVELGYFFRNGHWLTELSQQTLVAELPLRIYEWFLGSLVVAPVAGVLMGLVVFALARALKSARRVRESH